MLQDGSRELARWFSSKPEARRLVREAGKAIALERRKWEGANYELKVIPMTEKTRNRLTITAIVEYDADPRFYEDTSPEGMLATDIANAEDDTFAVLDGAVSWEIKGEILK